MTLDMPALRIALKEKGQTIQDYLAKERFEYLWTDPSVMAGEFSSWILDHYEKVYAYEFTEKPATFQYSIYKLKER